MIPEKKIVADGKAITAKLLPSQIAELDNYKGVFEDALAEMKKELALLDAKYTGALPSLSFDTLETYVKALGVAVQTGQIEVDANSKQHTLSGAGFRKALTDYMRSLTEVKVPGNLSVVEETKLSDEVHKLKGNVSIMASLFATIKDDMDQIAAEAAKRSQGASR